MKTLAVAVSAVVLLAACGDNGGEPITFDAYAPMIADIFTETDSALQRLADEYDQQQLADEEAVLAAERQLLEDYAAVFNDAADRLENITPPDEVRQEHQRFRETSRDAADVLDDYAGDINTDDEQETNAALSLALSDFEQACGQLRFALQANGAGINISCVIGESG